jgi:hypothetical protein
MFIFETLTAPQDIAVNNHKGQFDMVGTLVKYMVHLWTQKHNFLTTYSFKSFFMIVSTVSSLTLTILRPSIRKDVLVNRFGPVNKPGLLQADD